jgi:hypothetical protein
MDDPFTVGSASGAAPFSEGKDKERHRNSWLMPILGRRLTRNNKYHVSNWRQDVVIDTTTECRRLSAALAEQFGANDLDAAQTYLPAACKGTPMVAPPKK